MPNIVEYSANQNIQPTELGIEATAQAARRINQFYNQWGEGLRDLGNRAGSEFGRSVQDAGDAAVQFEEHREISHGAASFAQYWSSKTDQWNDIAKNADPNDPTVKQRFMDSMEPELDKFREGMLTDGGQKWAEQHIDQFRQHMFEKTSADMSTLAGEAAVQNSRQLVNSLSNTVRSDPSSLDYSLDHLNSAAGAIVDSSPNLGARAGEVKMKLLEQGREEIVKSAALGAIEKTGMVPSWVTDPKYSKYVNGGELKQFEQAARYYKRMGDAEDRATRQEQDYNAKKDFNSKIDDLEAATMPKNAGEQPSLPSNYWDTLRDLSKHPGAALEPGRLASMVQKGEVLTDRLNKPEPLGRVSHDTTMSLLGDIRSGTMTDNNPIYKAYQDGKLNNADFHFLSNEFAQRATPDGERLDKDRTNFMGQYKRLIDGAMSATGEHSLLGTQQTYEFEMDARRQEADLRRRNLDPHLLYDPSSEYFVGRPENIAKYRVTLQEAQKYEAGMRTVDQSLERDRAKEAAGPVSVSIPAGMSPADAIKQFGGKTVRLPDGRVMTLPKQ